MACADPAPPAALRLTAPPPPVGFSLTVAQVVVVLEVIVLAEERRLVARVQVEDLARGELLGARGAREAAKVVHLQVRNDIGDHVITDGE